MNDTCFGINNQGELTLDLNIGHVPCKWFEKYPLELLENPKAIYTTA